MAKPSAVNCIFRKCDNMDDFSRFAIVFIDTLLPMAFGMFLKRRGLPREYLRLMIRINVVGVLFLLSIVSFWSVHITAELLWLPISIIPISLIPSAIFFLFEKRRFQDPREQGSYLISMMLGNIGTASGLAAFVLYGEKGFAYVQMVAIPQILPIVLCAFPLGAYYYDKWAHKGEGGRQKIQIGKMLLTWNQLPVVGVFIGLALSGMEISRPASLTLIFDILIHLNAWFGMVPVGYDLDLRSARAYAGKLWAIFPVKFLILPAALYGLTTLFVDDPAIIVCVVLSAAAPTAIFSVATAQLYNLNVDLAESSFLTTTLAFLFIVYPVLYWWAKSFG